MAGSGGREHALAWKLAQSRLLADGAGTLYATPGNPGIAQHAELVALDLTDHAAVIRFCADKRIGLVVIGPEAPLVDGLADSLRAQFVPVFGPSQAAAQLEGSKGFTKDLCERTGIPTAGYVRTRSLEEATAALGRFAAPYVLKADGLAAGKGVVIAETRAEAEDALADMFGGAFGEAGAEVVIEEFMTGEEASFFAITDGATIVPFGSAQDHKRVGEGDTGPNTGGMGAYSPAPVLTALLEGEVIERIIAPTVRAMANEGMPYSGVLYAGLMLTAEGPRLIEYNARFGDPETQVLMPRLKSDIVPLLLASADGALAHVDARWDERAALTVVVASEGYPGPVTKGAVIRHIEAAEKTGAIVFHAGTARNTAGQIVANGGRVLNVTALGATVTAAQTAAYAAVAQIDWPEGFCRRDIGWREVARERG